MTLRNGHIEVMVRTQLKFFHFWTTEAACCLIDCRRERRSANSAERAKRRQTDLWMLFQYRWIEKSILEQRIPPNTAEYHQHKLRLSEVLGQSQQNYLEEHRICQYLFGRLDMADCNYSCFKGYQIPWTFSMRCTATALLEKFAFQSCRWQVASICCHQGGFLSEKRTGSRSQCQGLKKVTGLDFLLHQC